MLFLSLLISACLSVIYLVVFVYLPRFLTGKFGIIHLSYRSGWLVGVRDISLRLQRRLKIGDWEVGLEVETAALGLLLARWKLPRLRLILSGLNVSTKIVEEKKVPPDSPLTSVNAAAPEGSAHEGGPSVATSLEAPKGSSADDVLVGSSEGRGREEGVVDEEEEVVDDDEPSLSLSSSSASSPSDGAAQRARLSTAMMGLQPKGTVKRRRSRRRKRRAPTGAPTAPRVGTYDPLRKLAHECPPAPAVDLKGEEDGEETGGEEGEGETRRRRSSVVQTNSKSLKKSTRRLYGTLSTMLIVALSRMAAHLLSVEVIDVELVAEAWVPKDRTKRRRRSDGGGHEGHVGGERE
eukprot:GHVU01149267.1.p1 GENE.GHVU01149267.1~~GHVU01149267.1.p1  ORF type:complete len:350 (+),score=63.14 GHVU01149267.1:546-1595(+)